MANICFNYIQAFAYSQALDKLKDHLILEKDVDIVDISDPIDGELTFTVESRWSPPAEWVCELTEKFSGVLIECEYEECGSDIWGKFGFRDGVLLFTMELPYLEGKHKSMVWNEFLECEAIPRLDDCESFNEFMDLFHFVDAKEHAELVEIYREHVTLQ
jgi:hypothetical protein